ncbi:MAG: DUF4838 domain-containing protein [Armatimonadetes bacterium]|nr:DUF4838 domain-containing protein [Armatimonadota bacterium]
MTVFIRGAMLLLLPTLLSSFADGSPDRQRPKDFQVVANGKPIATIVLAMKPTRSAEFAAAELRDHVRKITGATLPIVTDAEKVTGPRILVGESSATRALKLHMKDFKSQEYLIRFLPNTLVLMGKDDIAGPSDSPMPERVEGKFGKALRFDGTTDVFTVADCGFNDESGTMEAWFWMPSEPQKSKHGTILRLDGADPWTYHIIQRDMDSSGISYTTYDGTNGHGLRSKELEEGWHHVVGTHDVASGKMALFVDGISCGTTDYVKTTCKGALMGIGGMPGGSGSAIGNPFKGIIDEVRISKVARHVKTGAEGGPYSIDDGTTCLFHFDESDGPPRDLAGGLAGVNPPELFGDNGTLYAVYEFLERFCDVRWYAPTDLGLVCPNASTLAVRGRDIRRAPNMIHRWITPTSLFMPGPPERVSAKEVNLWKLRMRIGGQAFWVCHSFYGYYDRYLKDHPDWFAQGHSGQPPQMCYTNPEFIQQVVQDANDYFDGKGAKPGATAMGDVFGLVPMDNMSWCKCPRCQAELNKAQDSNQQFNNGKASDYIFNFVNKVAREVRKTHPGKWIGALAYSDYAYYPEKSKVEPNVVVQMCLHTRNWWCPSMEVNDRKVLNDWRTREPDRPLYLWLYYCFPALNAQFGDYHYFPGFFADVVVKQMAMYRKANLRGIFMEHSSEFGQSYLMDQLEFYVTLKLADDPTLDGRKLIEEFFTRYYGTAARPMRELYRRIEDTFSNPKYYPEEIQNSPAHQHQNEELAWGSLGTEERMAGFDALMQQAAATAVTPEEKQRVAMFKQGLWDYMVEGRKLYLTRREKRAQQLPQVQVPRLTDANGDPAQVDWVKAKDLGKWCSLSGDATDRKVESLIAHDGRYLYLQLTEYLDPSKLSSTGSIYDGDDWELFFALKRKDAYRQFCVAPSGKHFEKAYQENSDQWNSGAIVRSDTASSDRWAVMLALPLDKLLPGGLEPGGTFYANFYRASPGASQLLAWSPNFAGGFHETGRLGEMTLAPLP